MTDATGQRIATALEAQSIDKAAKTDLTSIIATGTTNATGATITKGTYFYLNGTLVQAKADIASGATFTSGTNYEAVTAGGLNSLQSNITLEFISYNNAGFHNSIYRGKYLGTSVTSAQWNAIGAGTFEDLYVGDYWTIGSVNWRIAAFDYYYRTGDSECTTHHVVVVPDTNLYSHVMNDTNVSTGAYVGSKMYTEGLTQAKTKINDSFGSAHILTHRAYLQNATANGRPSGGAWYDSTVELMTEMNVYGTKIFGCVSDGSTVPNNYTIDKSQYPLFALNPYMQSNRLWYWLRDVVSAAAFADVGSGGNAYYNGASDSNGVRPAFCIKG